MADLLLVDNDERILELTSWFLERAGHAVRTAPSYAQARDLLLERRAELVLADLELGEERGVEELPRLAAEGLLPQTLVVSGFLDADLEARLLAIPGVVGTLAKPVDLGTLERRVEEAVAGASGAPSTPAPEELQPVPPPAPVEAPAASAPVVPAPRTSEPDDEGWVEILPDPPASGGPLA